jgi:hypothetical protein
VSSTTIEESFAQTPAEPNIRQQVLILYLGSSALDSNVIGWSRYDGTGQSRPTMGDSDKPPYLTGVDALIDGWRLIQLSQIHPHLPGHEYDTSYLPYEVVFERLVRIND